MIQFWASSVRIGIPPGEKIQPQIEENGKKWDIDERIEKNNIEGKYGPNTKWQPKVIAQPKEP